MTFEHEYHYHGDYIKQEAKKMLHDHGYYCIFDNVVFAHEANPPSRYPGKYFEDWYINLNYFDKNIINLSSNSINCNECIKKIRQYLNLQYIGNNVCCTGIEKK